MSRRFPKMIGADSGDTTIERIQIDSLGNMAIGGKSTDFNFISTASSVNMQSFAALLAYPTFDYLWAVAFNIYNQDMRDMQFRPGADDQIMIFIGHNTVSMPTNLLIINSLTGMIMKQASINPAALEGKGRALFSSLGQILFATTNTAYNPLISILDLSNPMQSTYSFKKVTFAGSTFSLIQGKQSLGCFYATVDLDAAGMLGPPNPQCSGIVKITAAPTIAWYYYYLNQNYYPQNQEYFDVLGEGGALFTIGGRFGSLLITRTQLDNNGDPQYNEPYVYSETGDSLKNLHIRIINQNQFVGLFTGITQTFMMTITFHDPSFPSASPLAGFLNLQKTLIVQPVFNPSYIKLGILENMPTGSSTQEFFIIGMKTGTDSCKATFPLAGSGFISYSKQNENCDQVTQLSVSGTITQPLEGSITFSRHNMVAGQVILSSLSFNRLGLTSTNIPVPQLYQIEPACCYTIQNTPIDAEVLKIGFGPLNIPVPLFTIAELCTEQTFVFTYSIIAALKNGSPVPVPSFFTLDSQSQASQNKIIVRVTATNPLDVGTYIVSLKGELPNHQSLVLPIQVIIVTNSIIPSRIPDFSYTIGQPQVIQYNSYFLSTYPIPMRFYTIYQNGNLGFDSQIIEYKEINTTSFLIKVYSQNNTKPGFYRMEIRAKYSLHSSYEVKSLFEIQVLERCSAAQILNSPIKNITIKVDKVPKNQIYIHSFSLWSDQIGGGTCLPIKYQLKMQNGDNLPQQIIFQKQNMKMIINYMNNLTVKSGIYPLTLKGSNNYFKWAQSEFFVTIQCFSQQLKPAQQYINLTYDIGSGIQVFKLPLFVQSPIVCQDEASYATFLFPSFEILPDFIKFYHDIDLENLVFIVNAYKNDDRITNGTIIQIVIIGNLTLQSGNLLTAQQKLQIRFNNKNETNQTVNKIDAKISKITSTGKITILFSKELKVPQNLTSINQNSLGIKLFSSLNDPINQIKLNWTIISLENKFLKLQLLFNDTVYVSNQKPWDKLTIEVLDQEVLQTQLIIDNKLKSISIPQGFLMSTLIPPQINPNSQFNQFLEQNEKTITTVLAINQVILYILSFSLQMLWGMINSLQLILLLPLVNIWFPSNAQILFKMLFQIFNFEFFDSIQLFKYLMPVFLQEEDFEKSNATIDFAFNEQFELNGYSSISSILNLGTMFFYAVGILIINLILILVNFILKLVDKKFKLIDYISNLVFHNLLIRFLIESYIQIIICAYINFAKVQIQGDLAVSLSSIFALLILAFGLLIILQSILIHRLLLKLEDSQQKLKSYSVFFESQKHPFPFYIDYTTWYFLRRFLFATIIVQLTHYPSLQLILLTTQGLATLVYLVSVHPFTDPLTNKLEIFNESCVLLAITNLYAFVREDENEMKVYAGWFIIGIVVLQLIINSVIMLAKSLKEYWVRAKRGIEWYKQRRREQDNKKCAESLAQPKISEYFQQIKEENQQNETQKKIRGKFKKDRGLNKVSKNFETDSVPKISYQKQSDYISLKPMQMFRPHQKYEIHQNTQNISYLETSFKKINFINQMETTKIQENQTYDKIQKSHLKTDLSQMFSRIRQDPGIKLTSQLEDNQKTQNIIIIPSFDAQLSQIKKTF